MTPEIAHSTVWALAKNQEWAVAGWQLAEIGLTYEAVRHRMREGRLHRMYQGVYSVGLRELSARGEWIAALLACGWKRPDGPDPIALSHSSAGTCLGMTAHRPGPVSISLDAAVVRRRPASMSTLPAQPLVGPAQAPRSTRGGPLARGAHPPFAATPHE